MVDYSTVNTFPYIQSIPATTNNTQIKMPNRARKVTIATKTGIVYFAYEGEDNGVMVDHHLFVTNYGMVEQTLGRGKDRPTYIYVAMASSTGNVIVSFEDEV